MAPKFHSNLLGALSLMLNDAGDHKVCNDLNWRKSKYNCTFNRSPHSVLAFWTIGLLDH
jgi:hypothetical protein